MMMETRPVGCGLFGFWVVLVVLVLFSTITLFFPFNDDLGTMPTRRPYSGKKKKEPRGAMRTSPGGGNVTSSSASFFGCFVFTA